MPTRLRGLVRRLDRADNLRSTMAEIIEVDYSDSASLCTAMEDADCIIHLAGALIPRPGETLLEANARLTESVVEAAQNVEVGNIVYLSYPGADPSAKNLYLRSKGLAEKAIQSSGLCGVIFRAPMVLGRGTATTQAILRLATKSFPLLAGGGTTRHQPIFQADVLSAIEWAVSTPPRFSAEIRPLGAGNDTPRRADPAGCGPLGPKAQNHTPSQVRRLARGLARRLSLFRENLQQDDLRNPLHRAPWKPVPRQDIPALFPDAPGRNGRPRLPEHRLRTKEYSPIPLWGRAHPIPKMR